MTFKEWILPSRVSGGLKKMIFKEDSTVHCWPPIYIKIRTTEVKKKAIFKTPSIETWNDNTIDRLKIAEL